MYKNIFLLCLCTLFASTIFSQTNISGGNVSGTWTKSGSPYKVNGNITIPNGSTLTIEPGVVVQFAQRKSLVVDGRIIAQGGAKSTDSIWFTRQLSLDTSSWKGIKFFKTANTNDTSIFKYCVFRNCRNTNDSALAYLSGGVTVLGYGKVKFANSTFYNNESCFGACIYILLSGYAKVQSCTFKNNAVSEFDYWDGTFYQPIGPTKGSTICVLRNSNCVIDSCIFKNNSRGKQYKPNPSINYEAPTVYISGSTYYKQDCFATITNSVFDGNEGITIEAYNRSYVAVNNCNFINAPKDKSLNVIHSYYLSDMRISNCNFTDNKCFSVLDAEGSKLSVTSSTIKNNENWISIIENDASNKTPTLLLQNCKILNNNKVLQDITATSGLGASNINNCLIANNYMDVLNSTNIFNSTLVNNRFGLWGIGGQPIYYPQSNFSSINVVNSIIWGNKLDSYINKQILIYPNTTASFINSIVENDTATFGWYSYGNKLLKPTVYKNNISSNPQFINPTTGVGFGYNASNADFSLKSTCIVFSPAINMGSSDTSYLRLPKLDLAGNARFYENRIDIGAYEDNSGIPIISITKQAKNDTLCEKSRPAQLSLNAIGKGLTYQWQKSTNGGSSWSNISGQTSNQLSITTTPNENSNLYRALLTGTCTNTTSDNYKIITNPIPMVDLGKDISICKYYGVKLTIFNNDGTYLWYNGETSNSVTQLNIAKDTILWLQIMNTEGCTNRDSIKITTLPLPIVNLGADKTITSTMQLTLDAGAGHSKYLWSDSTTTSTKTFYGSDLGPAGQYTIWVDVTDANGCSSRDSISITVTDNSGINSISNNPIKIHPQPASSVLNIEIPAAFLSHTIEYKITSLEGKLFINEQLISKQQAIDISTLSNGIYLIELINKSNGQVYILKWVKG